MPGIVVCKFDPDFEAQADRIHQAIAAQAKLVSQLLRVNRGQHASGVVDP